MEMKYLCQNHRRHFKDQPEQALECCIKASEKWKTLSQEGHWQESLPYIGCAYETAEIVLTSRSIQTAIAIEWLLFTSAGLTETLGKLKQTEARMQALQNTIDRLKTEAVIDARLRPQLGPIISQLAYDESGYLEFLEDTHSYPAQTVGQNQGKPVLH